MNVTKITHSSLILMQLLIEIITFKVKHKNSSCHDNSMKFYQDFKMRTLFGI